MLRMAKQTGNPKQTVEGKQAVPYVKNEPDGFSGNVVRRNGHESTRAATMEAYYLYKHSTARTTQG